MLTSSALRVTIINSPYTDNFFRLFFIHLKLELLTEFPALNDEK